MAGTATRSAVPARRLVAARVPGVATLELAMIARNGAHYVGPTYVADTAAADTLRRAVVRNLRAQALRGLPGAIGQVRQLTVTLERSRTAEIMCPWCGEYAGQKASIVRVAGRPLHARCAEQFDAMCGEG